MFGSLKHTASIHVSVLTWKYNAGNLQNNTIIITVSYNEILLKQKFAYSTYPFFAIPYSALNVYSLPFFSSPHLALLLVPVNIE